MFKINIMSIIKYISAIAYFYLAYHALYLVDRSKASPLPALIFIFMPCVRGKSGMFGQYNLFSFIYCCSLSNV